MTLGGLIDSKYVLHSPLSKQECARRLNEKMDRWWMIFGPNRIIGHASSGRLVARVRIYYGNSFQTLLRARLLDVDKGTSLTCRLGIRPALKIFVVCWFGFLLLAAVSNFFSMPGAATSWKFYLGLAAMTGFGVGLIAFCRWLARDEEAKLVEFLRATVEASERPSPIVG